MTYFFGRLSVFNKLKSCYLCSKEGDDGKKGYIKTAVYVNEKSKMLLKRFLKGPFELKF